MPEGIGILHPDHLADLRQSGLTDETIRALDVYSARPGDLPKLVGFEPPGVSSALVFPYPGEDGFCLVKVVPPIKTRMDTPSSISRNRRVGSISTSPRWRPPCWAIRRCPSSGSKARKKPPRPIRRGSRASAWAGSGTGWRTAGPSPGSTPSPTSSRRRVFVPTQMRGAVLTSSERCMRSGKRWKPGGRVLVIVIPPGPNGEKRRLDDYLGAMEQQGVSAQEALAKLKRISLKHPAFSHASGWWREWRKRKALPQDSRTSPSSTPWPLRAGGGPP